MHLTVWKLLQTRDFWLSLVPCSVYVGFFNSVSTLLSQILSPYGFSNNQVGIAGSLLVFVDLAPLDVNWRSGHSDLPYRMDVVER